MGPHIESHWGSKAQICAEKLKDARQEAHGSLAAFLPTEMSGKEFVWGHLTNPTAGEHGLDEATITSPIHQGREVQSPAPAVQQRSRRRLLATQKDDVDLLNPFIPPPGSPLWFTFVRAQEKGGD